MVDDDKLFDEEEDLPEIPEEEEDEDDLDLEDEDEDDTLDELDPKHLNSLGFGVEEDEMF